MDNKIIDTYGNKTIKLGIGQYMNIRYEIWENGVLRVWSSNKDVIMDHWNRIKTTEPPIRKREKLPFINWETEELLD